ncbi:MAG: hypothetical protein ACD_75C02148G0001 [uncultured bacterium]|nr:MAG: hypothetical protein ACD_75C02148G0001 [uncultured bacterium]
MKVMAKSVSMARTGVGRVLRFSIFSSAICFCFTSSVMSRIYSSAPLMLPLSSLTGAPVYLIGTMTPSLGRAMVCSVTMESVFIARAQAHLSVLQWGVLNRS